MIHDADEPVGAVVGAPWARRRGATRRAALRTASQIGAEGRASGQTHDGPRPARPVAALGIAAVAALVTAGLVAAVQRRVSQPLDRAARRRLRPYRTDRLRPAAKAVSAVGQPSAAMTVALVAGLWLARSGPRRLTAAALPVGATLGAVAAQRTLKALIRRRRPPGGWKPGKVESSFPSGHTAASLALATALAPALSRAGVRGARGAGAVAIGLAAAVALSRLYLDEHWLTDVLAGGAIGAGAAALAIAGDRGWRLADRG
jgi:membrane-associated phospholipid phosphatase